MKLQQLRYIYEVARHELNVSATAEALFTSQPGVSKQIRLLEDELGVQVFTRSGKHLTDITPAGRQILPIAARMLRDAQIVKDIAREYSQPQAGTLRLSACPLAARYLLHERLQKLTQDFAKVQIELRQADAQAAPQALHNGEIDLAITERSLTDSQLVSVPWRRWRYAWLSSSQRNGHRNGQSALLVYASDSELENELREKLSDDKSLQRWALVSADPDVIKTYVRNGWGVGLLPSLAFDAITDSDLQMQDAPAHLPQGQLWLTYRRDLFWRKFLVQFAQLLLPSLRAEVLHAAAQCRHPDELNQLVPTDQTPLQS